jgi:hypothetical protein
LLPAPLSDAARTLKATSSVTAGESAGALACSTEHRAGAVQQQQHSSSARSRVIHGDFDLTFMYHTFWFIIFILERIRATAHRSAVRGHKSVQEILRQSRNRSRRFMLMVKYVVKPALRVDTVCFKALACHRRFRSRVIPQQSTAVP